MNMKLSWIAVVGLVPGCSDPAARTEIIVVVDTDFSVPTEMDAVAIAVTRDDVTQTSLADLIVQGVPRTLGVVHDSGSLGPLTVVVTGKLGDQDVIDRTASVSFLPGRTVVLRMFLLKACENRDCMTQTCGEGGSCRPIEIDPAELIDWTGVPPRLDGGVDAPPDAPPDQSPPDMPTDVPPDVGPDTPECMPTAETCNGDDDDCNGRIDDGVECHADCTRVERKASAYQICERAVSWPEALMFCRSRGYDLVNINDAGENAFVWTEADGVTTDEWWIGLAFDTSDGQFHWVDGRLLADGYSNFEPGEPNSDGCVRMVSEQWRDQGCSGNSHPFVCEAQ